MENNVLLPPRCQMLLAVRSFLCADSCNNTESQAGLKAASLSGKDLLYIFTLSLLLYLVNWREEVDVSKELDHLCDGVRRQRAVTGEVRVAEDLGRGGLPLVPLGVLRVHA